MSVTQRLGLTRVVEQGSIENNDTKRDHSDPSFSDITIHFRPGAITDRRAFGFRGRGRTGVRYSNRIYHCYPNDVLYSKESKEIVSLDYSGNVRNSDIPNRCFSFVRAGLCNLENTSAVNIEWRNFDVVGIRKSFNRIPGSYMDCLKYT